MALDDRTPWLEALFGRVWSDGDPLALQGGLNFRDGLRATVDRVNRRIDVTLSAALALAGSEISNDSSVVGTTVSEALDTLLALFGATPAAPTVQYVNGVTGDDEADGLTPSTPVATLDRAVSRLGDRITQDTKIIIQGPSPLPGGYSVAELARIRVIEAQLAIVGESWSTTADGISTLGYDTTEAQVTLSTLDLSADDDYVGQYLEIVSSTEPSLVGLRRLISRSEASTGKVWLTAGFAADLPAGSAVRVVRPSVVLDLDTALTGDAQRVVFRSQELRGLDYTFTPPSGLTWVHLELASTLQTQAEFAGVHTFLGVHYSPLDGSVFLTSGGGRIGRLFGSPSFLGLTNTDIYGHGLVTGRIVGAVWTPGTDGSYANSVTIEAATYAWVNIVSGQLAVASGSFVIVRGCRLKGWEFAATTGSLYGKGESRIWVGAVWPSGEYAGLPTIDGPSATAQVSIEYAAQLDVIGRVVSPTGSGRWLIRYGGATMNLRDDLDTGDSPLDIYGGAKLRMQGNRSVGIHSLYVGYNDTTDHVDSFSFVGAAVLAVDGSAAFRTS